MKLNLKINSLFLAFFLLFVINSKAQDTFHDSCGTKITDESLLYVSGYKTQIKHYENEFANLITKTRKANPNKSAPIALNSIPVKAHIIRPTNGNGGLNTQDLDAAIADLNTLYADAFMSFFLCDGINYIDNDDYYYHFKKSEENNLTNAHYVPGVINIYFTNYVEVSEGNSLCGYSNTFGVSKDVIVMKNKCATNGTSFAHEVGHFFSLLHTHGPDNNKLTTELVNGYNCDTNGDSICDTPADPGLSPQNISSDCTYKGHLTDANGDIYAPDVQNIMSYSRATCKSHFSPQQLARIYAFYKSARSYLACPSQHVNFIADAYQECGNSLTVNFKDLSTGATTWEWDVNGDSIIDYTIQNPTHTYTTGIYDVTLTVKTNSNTISKTFSQIIKVGTQEDTTLNEDFDSFDFASANGWSAIDVSGNGFNWLVNSGETVSKGTGPSADSKINTQNANSYIYTEASGSNIGDIADYVSPCINVNASSAQLEFYYHMYGAQIGELHIDIETKDNYFYDVTPALIGQQQNNQNNNFIAQTVDLSSYFDETINIHFRAIRGSGWLGDIAIGAISISENTTSTIIQPEDLKTNTSHNDKKNKLKLFPNPVTNGLVNVMTTNYSQESYYTISNLVGQVFLRGGLTSSAQQIDVSILPPGSYALTLYKDDRTESITRFIK